MFENIIAGLVSGGVVSFLVLVVSKLWKGVIEPWFEERVYKDLHIEGKWYSLYVETGDLRQDTINIKRHGHVITGNMTCKTGQDDGEEYSLSGSFRNMLLPLTYEASDKSKSDRGTITLKSTFNGQRLRGEIAMYETRRDRIETTKVIWFRNKDELNKTIVFIKKHREKLQEMIKREAKIKEELSEFFEEFAKEYYRKKKEETESDKNAIDGEATLIESHDKAA